MQRVVDGSKVRIPADLRAELPSLLWLYEMSVILFWIHDESKDRARTRQLIERTCALVGRLIGLAGNPFLRPMRREVLDLVAGLRSGTDITRVRKRPRS
jgi:hypothetical protein